MSTFSTKKTIFCSPSIIPQMAQGITQHFQNEGYEVMSTPLFNGGYDISITKGGTFKAVLGMRTALKVTLTPQGDSVFFDASVGIFGQQAIPTIISMFVFWPVLITQIWGMVNQSHLDDKVLNVAESIAYSTMNNQSPFVGQAAGQVTQEASTFCPSCGSSLSGSPKFCPNCGAKL